MDCGGFRKALAGAFRASLRNLILMKTSGIKVVTTPGIGCAPHPRHRRFLTVIAADRTGCTLPPYRPSFASAPSAGSERSPPARAARPDSEGVGGHLPTVLPVQIAFRLCQIDCTYESPPAPISGSQPRNRGGGSDCMDSQPWRNLLSEFFPSRANTTATFSPLMHLMSFCRPIPSAPI